VTYILCSWKALLNKSLNNSCAVRLYARINHDNSCGYNLWLNVSKMHAAFTVGPCCKTICFPQDPCKHFGCYLKFN
jgi:hypothetical protein